MKKKLLKTRFLILGWKKPSDATCSVVNCLIMWRSEHWSVASRHICIIPLNKVWLEMLREDQFFSVLVLNSMHFKWLELHFLLQLTHYLTDNLDRKQIGFVCGMGTYANLRLLINNATNRICFLCFSAKIFFSWRLFKTFPLRNLKKFFTFSISKIFKKKFSIYFATFFWIFR